MEKEEIKRDCYILDMNGMSGGFVLMGLFLLVVVILTILNIGKIYETDNYNIDYTIIMVVSAVFYSLFMFMMIAGLKSREDMVKILVSGSVAEGVAVQKREREVTVGKTGRGINYIYMCKFDIRLSHGSVKTVYGEMDKRFDGSMNIGDKVKIRYSPEKFKYCYQEIEGEELRSFLSNIVYIIILVFGILSFAVVIFMLAYSFNIKALTVFHEPKVFINTFYKEILSHRIERKLLEFFIIFEGLGMLLFGAYSLISPAAIKAKKYKRYKNIVESFE